FVPGAWLAGQVYDVVTLQPMGAFVIDVNNWRMGTGSCILCDNELLNGVLPVSVEDWRTPGSCQRSLSSRLYQSAAKLSESATSSIQERLACGHSSGNAQSWCPDGAGWIPIQDGGVCLPTSSVSHDKDPYQKLVATYGTHYLTAVELCGRYKDVTAIRTCEAAFEGYTAVEVKDCLSQSYKRCQEEARSMKLHKNFQQAFSDRETEVTGGHASQGVDPFFSGDKSAFTRWTDSLLTSPGLVHYALAPLHHLLPAGDPRQKNVRRYFGEYIMGKALSQKCVSRRARNFGGDYFESTDGYVVIKYGEAQTRTAVISGNNYPKWNARLDLGEVKAESGHKLTFEVWDNDSPKSDELLGKWQVRLTSGTHSEVCFLNYGQVTSDYTFTCGLHLGGANLPGLQARPWQCPLHHCPGLKQPHLPSQHTLAHQLLQIAINT
ncbi:perforin-1-like, partial [Chiloscyllium plagiosum]|uniref:perforin-1-like n=1 Tax=Chiloscyllium plagiosum TaxID=36176 RepID=UPI001CB87E93